MRYLIVIIMIIFISSCSPRDTLSDKVIYSYLPNCLNLDSLYVILPALPNKIDSSLQYFKQIPIDSGEKSPKDGILISERTAADYIFYKAGYERQFQQLKSSQFLIDQYCSKSKEAEKLYQNQIEILKKQSERTWLEKNIVYLGFLGGLATAILTEFAVFNSK